MSFMDLKVDFAFKQLFGTAGHEPILIAFLNAALTRWRDNPLVAIHYLNSEVPPQHADEKKAVLDIYAQANDGTHINIEIQVANQWDMGERTLYYWASMYTKQMRPGMPYRDLSPAITVNIVDFRYISGSDQYHSTFHLVEDTTRIPLTDVLEIHFMEIPTVMRQWQMGQVNLQDDRLARWLLLLEADDHADIRKALEALTMDDPAMKQAFDAWEDLSQDADKWAAYESRRKALLDEAARVRTAEVREQQAREAGYNEGHYAGHIEGRLEEKRVMVRHLLAVGVSIEIICEVSRLSRDEVEAIRNSRQ